MDLIHDPRLAVRHGHKGIPGGVAELGDDGIVPPGQLPAGLGASPVSSVNGHVGAVVLTYSDVGAVSATDPRLTDQRTPLDGSVTGAKIAAALKPSGSATDTTEALRALGTTAGTAAAGNDARLSDQRTPLDGSVTAAKVAASLKPSGTAAAGTEALRALGTTAGTAAAGNDVRLSDSRAPTGAAGGVLSGTYPNPGLASNVTLPGTPTVGTPPGTGDNSAAVATTAFVQTRASTLATAWLGTVNLADFPRTTGESDDSGRFTRALSASSGGIDITRGGTLLVPFGAYTMPTMPDLSGSQNVRILGVGGRTDGGAAAVYIQLTGAAARLVDLRGSFGFQTADVMWVYTNASHTGKVFDLSHSSTTSPANRDSNFATFERCTIGGASSSAVGASSLISLANAHSHRVREINFMNAACAIRGRDAAGDYSNAITIDHCHFSSSITGAPVQSVGDAWTIITPVGEGLSSGAAGFYSDPTAGGGGAAHGLVVDSPWFGDTNGTGTWFDFNGAGLSIRGGYIASAGTAVKLAGSSYGCSVRDVTFDTNVLVFDVGDSCQHLSLIPNNFKSNTTLIRYRNASGTQLAVGTQGVIYSSQVPPPTNAISTVGDAKLAGTWFADQMEFTAYVAAYANTANGTVLGRTASGVPGPGVAFGSTLDVNVYKSGSALKTDNAFQAASYAVGTTALASTHLSDSAALARLASPAFTGVVSAPLGAVGAPSYTFTGDTDTGLWSPAANTLALSTGGSERFRIDSGGHIGLAGVSLAAWEVPAIESTNTAIRFGGAADLHMLSNAYYDGAWKYKTTGPAANFYAYNGQAVMRVAASGAANGAITWAEKFRVDTGGLAFFGIATSQARPSAYSLGTVTASRSLTDTSNTAAVLRQLIADLQGYGLLQ